MPCKRRIPATAIPCSLQIIVASRLALTTPYTSHNTAVITMHYTNVNTIVNTNIFTSVFALVMACVDTFVNHELVAKYGLIFVSRAYKIGVY